MKNLLTILILVGVAGTMLALSFSKPKKSPQTIEDIGFLPENAKVVKDLGSGWVVFEIEGKKFVYRYNRYGNATTEVIAPWTE